MWFYLLSVCGELRVQEAGGLGTYGHTDSEDLAYGNLSLICVEVCLRKD